MSNLDEDSPKTEPATPKQPAERAQPIEHAQRQTEGNPEEKKGRPEPREADGD